MDNEVERILGISDSDKPSHSLPDQPKSDVVGEEPTTIRRQNRVERVGLAGGLIGMLSSNPRLALQRKIDEVNSQGWYVRQIIDDSTGNLFVYILRFVILILTLFLYTPANGYFIILEREVRRD